MASVGEEDVEYESDPEETKLSLAMRRREASDDEEEEEEEEREGSERERRDNPLRRVDSDVQSDDQGAAADYDDEKESEIEEEEEYAEEVEEERDYDETVGEAIVKGYVKVEDANGEDEERGKSVGESTEFREENQGEEEKKESEPFAVPTAGAFYMHDDRFRNNAGGRNRRTIGGIKLWELKDDKKWGHDKFEEMSLHERHNEEGRRNSRSHYRNRAKNQGPDHGNQGVNQSKASNNSNQNHAPKTVRGRGPRRYAPAIRNSSEVPPTGNKRTGKFVEKSSLGTSGRAPALSSKMEPDPLPNRKNAFASSLSSASPPFYPSGSSNKEINLTQKRDTQAGSINRNLQTAIVDESFSISQSNSMLRGKDGGDSIGMDKLYVDDTMYPVAGKPSANYQLPSSGFSLMNSALPSQFRAQGRGRTSSGIQPTTHIQASRVSPPVQLNDVHRSPVQSRTQQQPNQQASAQPSGLRRGSRSESSSPPKGALSRNSFETGEVESPSESGKSKNALVGKVQGGVQAIGRGTFMYGAAQVMGASGNMGGGDPSFPPTPAFLPVMPFGSQHRNGMGVPAVGMAFPGYVTQPQLGLGNSEMAWLPVLAGAAGALGQTYCPPYIALDGAYQAARQSGQASSSSASSKETNTNISNNEEKPPQRLELTNGEFGQRQNNARRYSKMNFGQ